MTQKRRFDILGRAKSKFFPEGIGASNADFVLLVAGDLTKDGARQSHEGMVEVLTQLEAAGKTVYVVPGNKQWKA